MQLHKHKHLQIKRKHVHQDIAPYKYRPTACRFKTLINKPCHAQQYLEKTCQWALDKSSAALDRGKVDLASAPPTGGECGMPWRVWCLGMCYL